MRAPCGKMMPQEETWNPRVRRGVREFGLELIWFRFPDWWIIRTLLAGIPNIFLFANHKVQGESKYVKLLIHITHFWSNKDSSRWNVQSNLAGSSGILLLWKHVQLLRISMHSPYLKNPTYTSWKTHMTNANTTIWRCICYFKKWWFSTVILVFFWGGGTIV